MAKTNSTTKTTAPVASSTTKDPVAEVESAQKHPTTKEMLGALLAVVVAERAVSVNGRRPVSIKELDDAIANAEALFERMK